MISNAPDRTIAPIVPSPRSYHRPDRTIAPIMDRHRARAVLQVLASDDCNGAAPESLPADVLDTFGLGCARAKLRACLGHLERSGFVALTPSSNVTVVRLIQEGSVVACGLAHADGLQALSPGDSQ